MAFSQGDPAMGLIPIHTPLASQTKVFDVSGTVYPGMLLDMSDTTGAVSQRALAATGPAIGVCLDYALIGDKATVCIDPRMVYKVKGNSAFGVTNYGNYCNMADIAVNPNTLMAASLAETSSLADTADTVDILKVLGEYTGVDVGQSVSWFEVQVTPVEFA